jgi:hypothetical protein
VTHLYHFLHHSLDLHQVIIVDFIHVVMVKVFIELFKLHNHVSANVPSTLVCYLLGYSLDLPIISGIEL